MIRSIALIVVGLVLAPTSALASFHVMQIERVTAGIGADATAQAIQLRMRANAQNQVQLAKIIAYDAAGANPVTIVDRGSAVPNGCTGSRVLIGTASFSANTNPNAVVDFAMTNPIPESYLAAGSLTFVHDGGNVYWRFSWGGDGYTGSNAGLTLNDADGNFGPPVASGLPVDGSAWVFQGAATALSTSNLADYALEAQAPFTNNAGNSFTPVSTSGLPGDGTWVRLRSAYPNPFGAAGTRLQFDLTDPQEVTIRVISYDGRLVRSVQTGSLDSGIHTASWDGLDDLGRAVVPGVYFLQILTPRVRRATKVVKTP